jgi:hypothetical protein
MVFTGIEDIAVLIDIGKLDCLSDPEAPRIRRFLAGDHPE